MQPPIERPLARARAHMSAGRLRQAVGAFRATLAIDPEAVEAQVGLARARTELGERDDAIDELLAAGSAHVQAKRHTAALTVFGVALTLDPSRHEIHLDVAQVEHALGRHDDAIIRIETLADGFMRSGYTDAAVELLRFVTNWGEEQGAAPKTTTSSETVVCTTMLLRPDGTPMTMSADDAPTTRVRRIVSAPIRLDDDAPTPARFAPARSAPDSSVQLDAPTVVRRAPKRPGAPLSGHAPAAPAPNEARHARSKFRLDRAPRPSSPTSPRSHSGPRLPTPRPAAASATPPRSSVVRASSASASTHSGSHPSARVQIPSPPAYGRTPRSAQSSSTLAERLLRMPTAHTPTPRPPTIDDEITQRLQRIL